MYEFTHTDRRTDTGRDIVASAMKQIATKKSESVCLKMVLSLNCNILL